MSALTRQMLKFKPMSTNQGWCAQLPNGGKVFEWKPERFAYPIPRYEHRDINDDLVAKGDNLRDVLPNLADDSIVGHLQVTAKAWKEARDSERDLATEAYAAIVDAVAAGISEVQVAKIAKVDRMTVRRALGKRGKHHG